MKAHELRELTQDELAKRQDELEMELLNLRHQEAIKKLENPKRIREAKREIARILTIKREKDLNIKKR
ncbi:MAG: 50S ribosomal protein L29 [bacterium]|nr:50S ribosomal protein L29 [bacterium]